jgi:hypothetical protein
VCSCPFKFSNPKGQQLTREEIQAINPEETLTEYYRSLLSEHAVKVFQKIWFDAAYKNKNVLVVDDREVVSRIRIPYQQLHAAQKELVKVGLLKIDRINDRTCRYEFLDAPEPEAESDEAIWQQYADAL